MTKRPVDVDERTITVDNAAGNQAFKATGWFLVIVMGVRGFRPEWTAWRGFPVDILAVALGGWAVWAWHAWRNQIIPRRWLLKMLISAVVAAAVALLVVGVRTWASR